MHPDRWREIRAAFDELIDLTPSGQARRLAVLHDADPDLRRGVEALLRADAEADSRLAGVTLALVPPTHPLPVDGRVADILGLTGQTVSHFRLIEPLGAGGMGVVYAAEDLRLGRTVALKLPLPAHRLDSSVKARFLQEARSIGALDHPSLCSVYEAGESEDGLLYLAMALYRGETLKARVSREGALPVAEAIGIARQVVQGLATAHEAGIVHRDLKPANVMLPLAGGVKILDFGLAKVRDLSLTGSGMRLGTASYMSPEQIRGDSVDGRADLWSLGVVLYEMLTGRPPFRGEHEVSVAHAILHQEPLRPSALRAEIPPTLEDVVLSLLEKRAARRPASAQAVDAELVAVELGRSRRRGAAVRRWLRARSHQTAVAVVALAGAGLAAYRGLRPEAGEFEPNLLAVAPFEVPDSSLRFWREGLVDILSLDLDGAGPLRTVPQTVVLQRWSGRIDRASAAELARRTGAELVVFGHLMRRGGDSIGLRVSVLDRSRDAIETGVEVVGEERRMGELADSLGVRILRALGRTRAISGHRHQSIGARSMPALKEFLGGEQLYRRGHYDSAFVRYDRALAEDSTFVLALRRLARVQGWRSAAAAPVPHPLEYIQRAVTLNRGLSPRDSALLTADSLGLAARTAGTAEELVANLYGQVRTLEELTERYPDDPEIWYLLGDLRMHGAPPLGGTPGPALAAFERSIALDSGFTPAYEHVVELAVQLGQMERAADYARAYPAISADALDAESFRLVEMIFHAGTVQGAPVAGILQAASAATLMAVGREHLRWYPDSAEAAVAVLREVATGDHDVSDAVPPVADTLMWRQHLASALAFRGRLRAAASEHGRLLTDPAASRFSATNDPFDDLALLGLVDDSQARRAYGHALDPEADWGGGGVSAPPRYLRGLRWWLARGDTVSIAGFGRRATAEAGAGKSPRAVLRGRYFGQVAAAYQALARGDSADAERMLGAIPDTLCLVGACFGEKLALARLLAARGEDRAAAELLDAWINVGSALPSAVFAVLERGKIAERLGDRAGARQRYRFVTKAWREPDPELRPYVAAARAGLERVGR